MPKYEIDYTITITGTIEVNGKDEDDAKENLNSMGLDELSDYGDCPDLDIDHIKLVEEEVVEEKPKDIVLPGQMNMFEDVVDQICETCTYELSKRKCTGCYTNNGVTKERRLHWEAKGA